MIDGAYTQGHWSIQLVGSWGQREGLIHDNETWSYAQLCGLVDGWTAELKRPGILPGRSLAICGDYSPQVCALLLAALANRNIIVPLSSAMVRHWDRMTRIAEVQVSISFLTDGLS